MNMIPCNKGKCEYWDSDRNGGHCMLLQPECKKFKKENKLLKLKSANKYGSQIYHK